MATPKEIFAEIESQLKANPERAKNELAAVYKFILTGDDGGTWIVDCNAVEVREAPDEEGECTITVTSEDWVAIHSGELDAMNAFMLGKIQLEGDMSLAMKLQQVISPEE